MRVVDIVIGVGWIVFWIYWLAMSAGVKAGQTRWGQFAGFRVGLIIIVLLLLRLRLLKSRSLVVHSPLLLGIGLAIWVLGLALAIWARVYIGRNWGMPMSRKDNPELVTSGPYRSIRHPIYTGILLAMVGTTVAVSLYWLIAVVVIGGYFIFSAVNEERYMTEQFPDSYPPYKRSTKMLIPFIL
jgi:protein-S-isoprenylcysteine O-methyltransferase Ste14